MELYRTKPDNRIVIVDEAEFDRLEKSANLKEEQIEEKAKEMFLSYLKESGISVSYRVNPSPSVINYGVVTELNYDERGCPESIPEKVKHRIVDDLTYYINGHFEHYRDDCSEYIESRIDSYKNTHSKNIKLWKYLFYATLSALVALCFYIAL